MLNDVVDGLQHAVFVVGVEPWLRDARQSVRAQGKNSAAKLLGLLLEVGQVG